ncbi:MAG TPA: PH domain-containing protein [Ramlibacter sp.]|nr:PH domain-containing protein [Ramlibacter sp.]
MSVPQEQEQVVWSGQSSQWQNFPVFLASAVLALTVVGLIIAIPWALWRYLVTRTRQYKLTDQRLVITSGVINRKNEQIELFRVKDIDWEEPLMQRMFNLGRLTIRSTDSTDPIAILNAIPGGEQVVDTFRGAVTRLRQKNRVGVIETM